MPILIISVDTGKQLEQASKAWNAYFFTLISTIKLGLSSTRFKLAQLERKLKHLFKAICEGKSKIYIHVLTQWYLIWSNQLMIDL